MNLKYITDVTIDFKDSERVTKLFLNIEDMSFLQLLSTSSIEHPDEELEFYGKKWYYRTAKSTDQLKNEEFKELGYNTELGGWIVNTMVTSFFFETGAFSFT